MRSYILFFFISKDVVAELDIAGVGNTVTSDSSDDDDDCIDRKEESVAVVDHCNNCLGSFDIGRHDNLKIIFI